MTRIWSVPICLCIFVIGMALFQADSANAATLHVRQGGLLTSGSSITDDWTVANCFPDLATATLVAAPSDSILLFPETHALEVSVVLPSYLGNRYADANPLPVQLVVGLSGQMIVPAAVVGFEARGVSIVGVAGDSDKAAFLIEDGRALPADIRFTGCLFAGLSGSDMDGHGGSCIDANGDGHQTSLTIVGCHFEHNRTRGRGGAIYVMNNYLVDIIDSEFSHNTSANGVAQNEGRGGAIAVVSPLVPSVLSIANSDFLYNQAWGPGGSIFIDDASLFLVDTELSFSESAVGNQTDWSAGAGILMRRTESHREDISLEVDNCLFDGNIGHIELNPWAGDGGAILVKGIAERYVDVSVAESEFRNNYSAQGAGLYIGRFATGTVRACRFLENTAYLQGGGSFKGGAFAANTGETAMYQYCEFTGNRAGIDEFGNESLELGRGGAFSTRLYPRAVFYNCTFYNNSAHGPTHQGDAIMLPNEGGQFLSDLQRCQFFNTVFYGTEGNSVQMVVRPDAISRISHCAYGSGQVQTGGIEAENTVWLSDFPFDSEYDLRPGMGSPLINAADDFGFTTDLNNSLVPWGDGPDIGAFESRYGTIAVPDNPNVADRLSVWPNPCNPRANISFETTSRSEISLEIYDVSGRRVATLVRGIRDAGTIRESWDGVDTQGRNVPSGVYYARLRVREKGYIQKLTLVR